MKLFHLFDPATGALTGRTYSGPEISVSANVPAGLAAVEGHYDYLSQRVDVAKVAADRQAQLDTHAATVEVMRKNFGVGDFPGQVFKAPPAPFFVATAAHILDYQPPQPSADHEWSAANKRWQLTAAVQAKADAAAAIRARHAELITQQHDDVRRAVLGDTSARDRLQAIDDEVTKLQVG